MARERKRRTPAEEILELPEGKPLPDKANPGGTEGINSDWPGGSSNLGEVLNPAFEGSARYSTGDLAADVPRVDVVLQFQCDRCGQAFPTQAMLNVHRRTAHKPRP